VQDVTNVPDYLPAEIARHRIMNAKEASAFLSIPLPSFRREYRKGKLPKAVQLTERRLGWRLGDCIDWAEARTVQGGA